MFLRLYFILISWLALIATLWLNPALHARMRTMIRLLALVVTARVSASSGR